MEGDGPDLPTRFESIAELGSGGMGIVYEAFDRELGRRVAVKVFHDRSPATFDRIKREFRVAAAIRHPGLVRLGELFEHGGSMCFSMELVTGDELTSWVRASPDRAGRVRAVLVQVAGALGALHRAGIIHRDVKPANLMVADGERVVLLDLGLAVAVDGGERELAGTVEYVAPEQVQGGPITPAVDMYALGVLAFELITGRTPHEGAPLEILVGKTERDAPALSSLVKNVPLDLERIVGALLQRVPGSRPTARELELSLGEATAPAPRPRRVTGRQRTELIGRRGEIAALLAASENIGRRGRTVLYLLRGPAGVGKTAVLDAFAAAASARGHLVAFGRCGPREHLRYNGWDALIDAMARYLENLPAVEREALLPPTAVALSRMFPSFERVVDVTSTSADSSEQLVSDAVEAARALLVGIGQTRRVVSILDDAQWASAASFELLVRALRGPSPPCLVVFCVRTAAVLPPATVARISALLEQPIDVRFLDLGPLPDDDVAAMVTGLTGDPLLARRITAAAHGNPMFAEMLAREHDVDTDDVDELMRRRVAALPTDHARTLRTVVAATGPTRQAVIGHALAMGHDTLAQVLEHLHERGLVRLAGTTRADTCEVMHERVTTAVLAQRSDLADEHRRLAAALEELEPQRIERVIEHWVAAGEVARATAGALALIATARDVLAMERAITVCELVQTIAGDDVRLARRYGDALSYAGATERAAEAYAAASLHAVGDDRLDLERLAAEHLLRAGRLDEGMKFAKRVASQIGCDLDLSHASVLSRITIERVRNRWRGLTLSNRVSPADGASADACGSLSSGLSMVDTIRAAWFTSRGVRHALDSGDPRRAARALSLEATLLAARGSKHQARARECLAQARAFVARAGLIDERAGVEVASSVTSLLLGDYRAARQMAELAIELFRASAVGVAAERHIAEFFLVVATFWLGDWRELARAKRELLAVADATGDRFARLCVTTGVSVIADLIDGVPVDDIHAQIAQAAHDWPRSRAPSSYVRQVIAATVVDRYAGRDAQALARLEEAWPFLTKTRSTATEQVRGTLAFLRGGASLRVGRLAEASSEAKVLRGLPAMAAPGWLLEAAVERARGGDPLPALGNAIAAGEDAGFAAFVAAARARRGRCRGSEDGASELLFGNDAASKLGLGDPERAFALLAPWPD